MSRPRFTAAPGAYSGYLRGVLWLAPGRADEFKGRYRIFCRHNEEVAVQMIDRLAAGSAADVTLAGIAFSAIPRRQIHILVERRQFLLFSVSTVDGGPIKDVVHDRKENDIDVCLLDCGVGIPDANSAFYAHAQALAEDAEAFLQATRKK